MLSLKLKDLEPGDLFTLEDEDYPYIVDETNVLLKNLHQVSVVTPAGNTMAFDRNVEVMRCTVGYFAEFYVL